MKILNRTYTGLIIMIAGAFLILLPVFYDINHLVSIVSGALIFIFGASIFNGEEDYIEQIKLNGGIKMTKTKEHRHCLKCGKVIEDMTRSVCEECMDSLISELGQTEVEAAAKEELDKIIVPGSDEDEEELGGEVPEDDEDGDIEVPANSNGILGVDDDDDDMKDIDED